MTLVLQFSPLFLNQIDLPTHTLVSILIYAIEILTSIFSCIFFYSLFISLNEKYKEVANAKLIKFIDRNSFGLYLFHSSLLYPILNYSEELVINPILFSLIVFFTITIVSLILTVVISKIPYLKILVGK